MSCEAKCSAGAFWQDVPSRERRQGRYDASEVYLECTVTLYEGYNYQGRVIATVSSHEPGYEAGAGTDNVIDWKVKVKGFEGGPNGGRDSWLREYKSALLGSGCRNVELVDDDLSFINCKTDPHPICKNRGDGFKDGGWQYCVWSDWGGTEDNIKTSSSVPQLPSDLQDDICKMRLFPKERPTAQVSSKHTAPHTGPCVDDAAFCKGATQDMCTRVMPKVGDIGAEYRKECPVLCARCVPTKLTNECTQSTVFATIAEVNTVKGWVAADLPDFKGKPVTLTRCYSMKAANDGGNPATFHAACDGKGPTVTVVQAPNGRRFGGVADKSWAGSNGADIASDVAFLFCLDCFGPMARGTAKAHQLKRIKKGGSGALAYYTSHGPSFGVGNPDLFLQYGKTIYSQYLGATYTCPIGQSGTPACTTYMSGSTSSIPAANYEVFVMT